MLVGSLSQNILATRLMHIFATNSILFTLCVGYISNFTEALHPEGCITQAHSHRQHEASATQRQNQDITQRSCMTTEHVLAVHAVKVFHAV